MNRVPSDKSTRSQCFVEPEYESILSANKLAGVDDFFSLDGEVVRSVPGRTTRRVELKSPGGAGLIVYLKCYECALPWLQRWFGLNNPNEKSLESLNEWRQIHALRELGFRTAAPVAAGWQIGNAGAIRSFVMTAEISCAVQGYDFLAAHSDSKWRDLIQGIAGLARRFHQAGFIHKDFYLNHIFVSERSNGLELTLIDLQRVLGPGSFRTRWLIKDFGSMLYAFEKAGARRFSLLRLFKLYKGRQPLGVAEKKFLRKSLKRATWLHGRKPKFGEPESESF
jgi:hypothetical protein